MTPADLRQVVEALAQTSPVVHRADHHTGPVGHCVAALCIRINTALALPGVRDVLAGTEMCSTCGERPVTPEGGDYCESCLKEHYARLDAMARGEAERAVIASAWRYAAAEAAYSTLVARGDVTDEAEHIVAAEHAASHDELLASVAALTAAGRGTGEQG